MSHETQILNIDAQALIALPKTLDVELKQGQPNMNLVKLPIDCLKLFAQSMSDATQMPKEPHHGMGTVSGGMGWFGVVWDGMGTRCVVKGRYGDGMGVV